MQASAVPAKGSESGLNSISDLLKDTNKRQLVDSLKTIKGKKDLVLEAGVASLLDSIAGHSDLKSADVEKIFILEPGPSPGNTQRCVYLIRPSVATHKLIAEQVTIDRQKGKTLNHYHLICIPRRVLEFEAIFEYEGIYECVNIMELPLGLIALDTDVFSLEIPDFFSSYFLDGDFTWLVPVASALLQLQNISGLIPNWNGQGRCAKMIMDIMARLKEDMKIPDQKPVFDQLIIMDRDVDYVSLLLTQVNYAGLLDETFGYKSGKVTLSAEVLGTPKPTKYSLNSSDQVFLKIRDQHFTSAFTILKYQVDQIKTKHSELRGMDLKSMKKFVTTELNDVKKERSSISILVAMSDAMNKKPDELRELLTTEAALIDGIDIRESTNYIEDCINQQYPIYTTLRVLCLLSICQDGLASREYKSFAKLFLQSYGHEHLGTLHSLKKLGLLMEQQISSVGNPVLTGMMASAIKKSHFKNVAKKLLLNPVIENYDFRLPPNPAYVFGGVYIPIICRLTEQALQKDGLHGFEENLKLLPGPTTLCQNKRRTGSFVMNEGSNKNILVFFLGGVTQAEISALRFIGLQKGYTIMIGTTSVVNGSSILQSLSSGID